MNKQGNRKLKDYNPGNCPVIYCLNKIGNRWKLLIIHHIRQGSNRYSTLRKAIPEISGQSLTNQLREMEEDGIVSRTVFAEIPPRVEYQLTQNGESLLPVIQAMSQWGLQYVTPDAGK